MLAITLTVKNESEVLLLRLISYYRFVGAEIIFIFFDNINDPAYVAIERIPYVRAMFSGYAPEVDESDEICRLRGRLRFDHTSRQLLNIHRAVYLAGALGFEWMLSVDADELVVSDVDLSVRENSLLDYLSSYEEKIGSIVFESLELAPSRPVCDDPFREGFRFKKNYGLGEGRRNSDIKNDACYEYFDLTWLPVSGRSDRGVLSSGPFVGIGEGSMIDFYMGHSIGKVAFRIKSSCIIKNLHCVDLPCHESRVSERGRMLHYNCFSYSSFCDKFIRFSTHAKTYSRGAKVDEFKLYIRDVVCGYRKSIHTKFDIYSALYLYNSDRIYDIESCYPNAFCTVEGLVDFFSSM